MEESQIARYMLQSNRWHVNVGPKLPIYSNNKNTPGAAVKGTMFKFNSTSVGLAGGNYYMEYYNGMYQVKVLCESNVLLEISVNSPKYVWQYSQVLDSWDRMQTLAFENGDYTFSVNEIIWENKGYVYMFGMNYQNSMIAQIFITVC